MSNYSTKYTFYYSLNIPLLIYLTFGLFLKVPVGVDIYLVIPTNRCEVVAWINKQLITLLLNIQNPIKAL